MKAAVCLTLLCGMTALNAHGLTYAQKEYVCPIGGEAFLASIPMSGTSFGMRTDLKQIGAISSPWELPKCPSNHFVIFKSEFSDDELAKFASVIKSKAFQAIPKEASTYYYLANMLEMAGYPSSEVAYRYLQSSWELEGSNPTLRQQALQKSLTHYEISLKELSSATDDEEERLASAIVLVGELNRLLGHSDVAKQHFINYQNHPLITTHEHLKKLVTFELELIANKDSNPSIITP